ncbi:MAG: Mut7-C RNAse domain-containing protein [Candidatus Aminicenantes bacterium]|nr:Mut7-C RNAse domain-containing protein [Candidatus Aminicenantes bacterium]
MVFIADCMLGKLAKWLRVLGFDVLYYSRVEDDELLRIAGRDGRVLLTRDTGLAGRARAVRTLLIDSERWEDQVRQVLDVFSLREEAAPHSRCIACNLALRPLAKERARNLVVPFVWERGRVFSLCPGCGRVYWEGSHAADMDVRIKRLLEPGRDRTAEAAGTAVEKKRGDKT